MSTGGQRLHTNIIADLHLRYPDLLGPYPFVAAVTVTATGLVTVTFQATHDLVDTGAFAPLAVVTVKNPTPWINYPLRGQYPGVGGWIVFGGGIADKPFSGRFLPAAGLLAPRAARPYHPLPVTSLAKLANNTPLSGVVRLKADPPIQIVGARYNINGVLRTVAEVSLVSPATPAGNPAANVLARFIGPCGQRPESNNCGDPAPIQSLNAVQPDCNGNITIRLRGCARIGKVLPAGGIVLDCGLGLIDVCAPAPLPARDGTLPNEYPGLCGPPTSTPPGTSEPAPPSEPAPIEPVSEPSSESVVGMLPKTLLYNDPDWLVVDGGFSTVTDAGSPPPTVTESLTTELPIHISEPAMAVWRGWDIQSVNRKYTAGVKLLSGGAQANAALIFNYQPDPLYPGRYNWFEVVIDRNNQQLAVQRFNGVSLLNMGASVNLTNLQLATWYRLVATVTAGAGDNVNINAQLRDDGGSFVAGVSLTTGRYYPDLGMPGLRADRSAARFSFLMIEEA